jgi:hypothetical protein
MSMAGYAVSQVTQRSRILAALAGDPLEIGDDKLLVIRREARPEPRSASGTMGGGFLVVGNRSLPRC